MRKWEQNKAENRNHTLRLSLIIYFIGHVYLLKEIEKTMTRKQFKTK